MGELWEENFKLDTIGWGWGWRKRGVISKDGDEVVL
jgi:hypothetical protein